MTSPVGQQKQDGKWVVSFMMPASFTLETTPEPKDPNVSIREVPARLIAAVRYSGFWAGKGVRNLIDGCGTSAYRVDPWVVRQEQHSADWFIMC
jgi:hypothetical protein